MSEEVKNPEPESQSGGPAIDMDALKAMMEGSVRETITKLAEEQRSQAPEPVAPQPQVGSDPLGDMIRPYIDPAIKSAMLEAQSAADYASFYTHNPKAAKYEDEIETKFNALKAKGTPFTRRDIWKWHLGENFDQFAKEAAEEQRKAAEEAARAAAGVGAGSPWRGDSGQRQDPFEMTHEDLTKALENQSF